MHIPGLLPSLTEPRSPGEGQVFILFNKLSGRLCCVAKLKPMTCRGPECGLWVEAWAIILALLSDSERVT